MANFIDRLPNFGIITPLGIRNPKKTPQFLSTTEIQCPKCGLIEYGNVDQKRVGMCSLCLMDRCLAAERKERELGPPLTRKMKPIRLSVSFMRNCHRCGDPFRGKK